jgi:hypothetical protein
MFDEVSKDLLLCLNFVKSLKMKPEGSVKKVENSD